MNVSAQSTLAMHNNHNNAEVVNMLILYLFLNYK